MMKICIFLGAGASAAENLPIQNEIFSRYFKYSLPKHPHSEMNKTLVNFFKEIFNIDIVHDNIDKVNFDIDSLYQSTLTRILLTKNDIEYYDELELFLAKFNELFYGCME